MTVTKDGLSNEVPNENQELFIDSFISQSRHSESERELKPWIPDDDDPQFPELDNIFDGPWNRLLCTSPIPYYLSFGNSLFMRSFPVDPQYLLIFL